MKPTNKTKHALCGLLSGLLSGLLLLAAGTAQTHAGLLVPAAPGAQLYQGNGSSNILAFTPGGVGSVFAYDPVNLGRVQDLAFDGAGNLFAADQNTGKISKITPNGVSSVFASANAYGLAFDNSGFLYTGDPNGTTITKYSPGGVASVFASGGGISAPTSMAFDNAGNLFVGNRFTGDIRKITPAGSVPPEMLSWSISVFHFGGEPSGTATGVNRTVH